MFSRLQQGRYSLTLIGLPSAKHQLCLHPFQTASHLLLSGFLCLLLISDWLELSVANDEEKCYSANHNEPGASSSIPGGTVSLGLGETKASISKAPSGGFSVLRLCPLYTVCSSDNQVPHYLPSLCWSCFIFQVPPCCIIALIDKRPCRKLCMM